MRISTLIGIILGLSSILGAFYIEGGDFVKLILPAPLMIVIGGTLMAGLASSNWHIFRSIFRLMKISFYPPTYNKQKIITQILDFSMTSRMIGMLDIEGMLKKVEHPFMRNMFQVGIDGGDAEVLEETYNFVIEGITQRHSNNIAFFHKLGGLSPTMGIIGTVMGLISTMGAAGNDGDAQTLILSISVAFLATLWGIALANLVWIPIGDKLHTVHNEELSILELIYQGARCVLNGEAPNTITSKLISTYPASEQNAIQREIRSFSDKRKQELKNFIKKNG